MAEIDHGESGAKCSMRDSMWPKRQVGILVFKQPDEKDKSTDPWSHFGGLGDSLVKWRGGL